MSTPSARLRIALDLFDLGEQMMRARLSREHPEWTERGRITHRARVHHRLATVRLRPPVPGGVLIDLLFASSGIEPEIIQEAERVELVPGLALPVARAAHLVKLLARDDTTRPQDSPTSSR